MKAVITVFILCLSVCSGAQGIDSVVIYPKFPTISDSISIRCYVSDPSYPCAIVYDSLIRIDTLFIGKAVHCDQLFAEICSISDTFILGKLSAGTYIFYFWPGFSYSCNFPVFGNGDTIPYPYVRDTIKFKVTDVNDLTTFLLGKINFRVYPNPTNNKLELEIQNPSSNSLQIAVTDISGQTLSLQTINPSIKNELDVSGLPAGLYFIQLQNEKGKATKKFVKL